VADPTKVKVREWERAEEEARILDSTVGGAVNSGKSPSTLKELFARSILNIESGIEIVATLSFITLSVSAAPEHDSGVPADFVIGPNLRTISVSKSTKVSTSVHAFVFHDSDSTRTVRPDVAGSFHVPGKELSMGSREVDFESLYDVFVSRWKIPHDALLDNLDTSREFIDHLAPL
nr:hypothetical protein [Tanacetum cinerariifolium]